MSCVAVARVRGLRRSSSWLSRRVLTSRRPGVSPAHATHHWLFPAPGGGPLRESDWKRTVHWSSAVAELGYPTLRVHDLRHTAASLSLAAGADPKVVQAVLGHFSAAMIMDVYGHLIATNLWHAAASLGGTTGAPHSRESGRRTGGGEEPGV